MRLNAVIIGAGLCLAPALSHAGQGPTVSSGATPVAATADQNQNPRGERANAAPKGDVARADDNVRYAQKEAESSEAQNYRGGDTIVIGASAAVAILAVILILVLI